MKQHHDISRRHFIKNAAVAASVLPVVSNTYFEWPITEENAPEVHVFSKCLHFLDHGRMAEFAAEVGFDGVDLTVRPGGHVLPASVSVDLPRAVEKIRSVGMKSTMITTTMADPSDSVGRKVLEVAADLSIPFYRSNYFHYLKDKSIPESIDFFQNRAKGLSELNKELNIVGCYQNHAGSLMGASLWELWELLRHVDHSYLGVQYDVRHAVVEGGLSWVNGLRLIQSQIKNVVVKDFKWVKHNDRWSLVGTPIGEGMVDFKRYFRMLKDFNMRVPISLHIEYPLGGVESGARQLTIEERTVFNAMRKDLLKVRKLWEEA